MSIMDCKIGIEQITATQMVMTTNAITSAKNNNNNKDRLTAFDPGQPG